MKKTLLKDLPKHIIKMLPMAWSLEKGINDPVSDDESMYKSERGLTPLLWALEMCDEVVDPLLQCEDIDLNKGDFTKRKMPLRLALQSMPCKFKLLLMKGADPTIQYFSSFSYDHDNKLKILDDVIYKFKFDLKNFSFALYCNNPDQSFLQLSEYIWNATQPIIADHQEICNLFDIRKEFPSYPSELLELISSYVGQPRNINDFSINPIQLPVQNCLLATGRMYEEHRIAHAKAEQARLQAEADAVAKADAEKRRAEAEKLKVEADLVNLKQEVSKLKETVETQENRIKQLTEMISLVIDLLPSTNKGELTKLQGQVNLMNHKPFNGLTFSNAANVSSAVATTSVLAKNTVNPVNTASISEIKVYQF